MTVIIVEKNVKSLVELQPLAHQQKKEGKTDIVKFLVNTMPRAVADILNTAWEFENAAEKLARSKKTPLELLQEVKEKECTEGCGGLWKNCAEEILANDQVPPQVFRDAVCDLTLIFNTFLNPAFGTFAWVGVQNAECIFLNNFRWSPQVILWHSSGMICYLCERVTLCIYRRRKLTSQRIFH